MPLKKAILFDLDGTLLDTSKDLQTALHAVQAHFHYPLSSLQDVENSMGHGIKALVLKHLKAEDSLEEALSLFNESYARCFMEQSEAYQGVFEGLLSLKALGYRLGVISNKEDDYVQALVEKHFKHCFDFVLGSKVNLAKKPHPAMLNAALKALNLTADEAIYVGDTEVDLDSAKAVNMDCLLIAYGYRSYEQLKALGVEVSLSVADCFKRLSCV